VNECGFPLGDDRFCRRRVRRGRCYQHKDKTVAPSALEPAKLDSGQVGGTVKQTGGKNTRGKQDRVGHTPPAREGNQGSILDDTESLIWLCESLRRHTAGMGSGLRSFEAMQNLHGMAALRRLAADGALPYGVRAVFADRPFWPICRDHRWSSPRHFAKVSKMALRRNNRLPGGMTQLECSQCAGQMDSSRRTRRAGVTVPEDADFVPAETFVDEDGELLYCCDQSTILLNAEEIRHFQLPPYGTAAHRIACGYRNPAEGSNSSIRNRGGLEDGWCRVLFKPAQFLGGLMLVLAHNTRIRRPKPPPKEQPDYNTAATDDTTTDPTDSATAEPASDTEHPPTVRPPPQPD